MFKFFPHFVNNKSGCYRRFKYIIIITSQCSNLTLSLYIFQFAVLLRISNIPRIDRSLQCVLQVSLENDVHFLPRRPEVHALLVALGYELYGRGVPEQI